MQSDHLGLLSILLSGDSQVDTIGESNNQFP